MYTSHVEVLRTADTRLAYHSRTSADSGVGDLLEEQTLVEFVLSRRVGATS